MASSYIPKIVCSEICDIKELLEVQVGGVNLKYKHMGNFTVREPFETILKTV